MTGERDVEAVVVFVMIWPLLVKVVVPTVAGTGYCVMVIVTGASVTVTGAQSSVWHAANVAERRVRRERVFIVVAAI